MALLVKKLSFLPFISTPASRSCAASYILARTFASRKSGNKASAVVINDVDETTTDEDEDMEESLEVVQAVDGGEVNDVPCRVTVPSQRRAWATSQDENAVRFRMDMPGVAKEDVKVYVDDMKLVVRGKYAQRKDDVDDESHVLADNVGVYSAELYLPDNVEIEKIKSQMKDGMLLVTVPKEVINVLVE